MSITINIPLVLSGFPIAHALVPRVRMERVTRGKKDINGSGYGTVGRAIASDTREPRFEFHHPQKLVYCELFIALIREKLMKK